MNRKLRPCAAAAACARRIKGIISASSCAMEKLPIAVSFTCNVAGVRKPNVHCVCYFYALSDAMLEKAGSEAQPPPPLPISRETTCCACV